MLAGLLASGLLFAVWWQVVQGKLALQNVLSLRSPDDALLEATMPLASPDDGDTSGDVALLHTRRGDVLLLQGEFAAAQQEFALAVDAGGGLPALRKLAAVQLQRRDL